MTAADVAETLRLRSTRGGTEPRHRAATAAAAERYPSAQLGAWLQEHGVSHTRGKPYHPTTRGKIERYHRSLKNRISLENYYLPDQLEARRTEFADFYNGRRHHESLGKRSHSRRHLLRPRDQPFLRAGRRLNSRPSNHDGGRIGRPPPEP